MGGAHMDIMYEIAATVGIIPIIARTAVYAAKVGNAYPFGASQHPRTRYRA